MLRLSGHGNSGYFLLAGRLKFFRLVQNRRGVIVRFCFPAKLFGRTEVIDPKERWVNVQTCEASQVAIVPEATFGPLPRHAPECVRASA